MSAPQTKLQWTASEGRPAPLGVTWLESEKSVDFAIYSAHAESVTLLLFTDADRTNPSLTFRFDFLRNKSGPVWHCRIPVSQIGDARYYGYSVSGQNLDGRHSFDPQKLLLDPYAKCVWFPPSFDRNLATREGPNIARAPLGVLITPGGPNLKQYPPLGHESDAIIYELHVRGFTKNPNSGVSLPRAGTYAGVVDKIPYLKDLGVTVVELMPVFQRDPQEGNYWGYMPLNFFAPHHKYASNPKMFCHYREFGSMVESLHEADIEVVIDVVYNHTAEGGNSGPIYSFKGLDCEAYYMMASDSANPFIDYSGTGNTLNFGSPHVRKMVLDSMRYWRRHMGVDGFRFDLASIFNRNPDGSLNWNDPPIFSEIASDPDLRNLRLIAEPWDAAGAYQLGRVFPGITWLQWNGRFRDDVRRFIRGDSGTVENFLRRMYGSDDFFPDDRESAYHAYQSVNYVDSHDGFTLYDLVSYNQKHNWANGHNNTDGMDQNYSWNCGYEGEKGAPKDVLALRRRQVKNYGCLLMLANGTPMFRAGDEFLQTQHGNNNPYNQDNEISWLDWDRWRSNQDIFRFFKEMIAFRKAHPSLGRSRFWREDVRWYGVGSTADLSYDSHSLAFCLFGTSQADDDIYVMVNAYWEALTFTIQEGNADQWRRVIDTSLASPDDISPAGALMKSLKYVVGPRSVAVFVRPRSTNPR
jgi:glycogen operon protein